MIGSVSSADGGGAFGTLSTGLRNLDSVVQNVTDVKARSKTEAVSEKPVTYTQEGTSTAEAGKAENRRFERVF